MAGQTGRLLDPDDDKREGPSIELPQDLAHFLDRNVAAAYEDGEPLDLGKHGKIDPTAPSRFD
jgi:hypothetical protein